MSRKNFKADVLVIGAGAAGTAAAIAAARAGASVIVAEGRTFPGGAATAGLVGTICGLYLQGETPCYASYGFSREFAEALLAINPREPIRSGKLHFLPYRVEDFRATCDGFLGHSRIRVRYNQAARDNFMALASSVVDCSGVAIGFPDDAEDIRNAQAFAIIFHLDGLPSGSSAVPLAVRRQIMRAIAGGELPERAGRFVMAPLPDEDAWYVKLPFEDESPLEVGHADYVRSIAEEFAKVLREAGGILSTAHVVRCADEIGWRLSRAAHGRATLTAEAVLNCEKPEGAVARGCWPLETWLPDGTMQLEYLRRDDDYYTIPDDCLRSAKYPNLFVAGRCISAEARALASARVIGTCLETGYRAGQLAAAHASR